MTAMTFPTTRPRRLRRNQLVRSLVAETRLSVDSLVLPFFAVHGEKIREEIPSMPGVFHLSCDRLVDEVRRSSALGIRSFLLFGLPEKKDPMGHEAYSDNGIVQQALRRIKDACPDVLLIADVCLCQYTSHGHCGELVVPSDPRVPGEEVRVDNDRSLELVARTATSLAHAGADIVAPSDMMDGRVGAIRKALDAEGMVDVGIMAYSAKYASAFYGPFRAAADSKPQQGDRKTYQMDPANVREALKEVALDIEEGADIVMVKPALAYLDVIRAVRERFDLPLAAYNVSGEYSMVKAAAAKGYLDEKRVVCEVALSIRRAGADILITYHANDLAEWIHG